MSPQVNQYTFYLAKVLKIPLRKKQTNELNPPLLYKPLQNTKTLSVIDFQNLQYYFTLELGTPAKTATFTLDTGSHLAWIPPFPKAQTQKYNYDLSSTAISSQQPGSIEYGIGEVTGILGSDVLSVPELGITGVRLEILWALQVEDMNGQRADGLTGFSNYKQYNNFLDLAFEDNQIQVRNFIYCNQFSQSSIFSIKLGYTSETCHFYAGGYATDISNITFLPCQSNSYWQIKVETMFVNNKKFTSSKLAIVDSGTSALVIPTDMQNYFLSQFPTDICKTYQSQTYGSFWGCECYYSPDNYPIFTFYTSKIKFEIDSVEYMFEEQMEIEGSMQCVAQPLIMTSDGLGFMIFGDVFMRKYLVTFDKVNNQVGFSGDNLVYMGYLNNKFLYIMSFITFGFFALLFSYSAAFLCFKTKQTPANQQPFLS